MRKSLIKCVSLMLFIITIISVLFFVNNAYAYTITGTFDGNTGDIDASAVSGVKKITGTILDIVRYVGIGIALIILMYIGAKIMMASPSERANIKQYAMNYVIGAFFLIGASGILTIVQSIVDNAFPG